jgi:crotonobetainyl-CoA:carnitine CoA-transferase CaiB-like acyl-CoA transferase
LFEDPHLNAADALAETRLPGGRTGKLPKIPLRLDGQTFGLRNHPPGIGDGTRELLKMAGLDETEISELLKSKIVDA